jgi:hypothetical protein
MRLHSHPGRNQFGIDVRIANRYLVQPIADSFVFQCREGAEPGPTHLNSLRQQCPYGTGTACPETSRRSARKLPDTQPSLEAAL